MCGQFEALLYLNLLKRYINLDDIAAPSEPVDPFVVKPTLGAPVVLIDPESRRPEIVPARFGLVPLWYKGHLNDFKATTFNARVEEAATKPTFKGAWRYRRCVVPAEAFYEWSGPKTSRTKWRITRGDNEPLAFAGLWDEAACGEGDIVSFTILTRKAGAAMSHIHTREPVVLAPHAWNDWLRLNPVDLEAPAPLRVQAAEPEETGTLSLF
jgi:putative SOS response-associated peptidase YedK